MNYKRAKLDGNDMENNTKQQGGNQPSSDQSPGAPGAFNSATIGLLSARRLFGFLLATGLVVACTTSPTGRKQLKYMPETQMSQMGDQAFKDLRSKKQTRPKSSKAHQKIRCIANRLLSGNGLQPSDWSVQVFEDPSPNAFALPGKNIGFNTGMIELVENDAQLAAVMGHEIAHVIAHHGNERVSQQMIVQGGLAAAQVMLGTDSTSDRLILGALGLGAQFGVLLPYSRRHESEADTLGIDYMVKGGYDPRQASRLWELMAKKSQGSTPEFLSTHPDSSKRAAELASQAKGLMDLFSKTKDNFEPCP